MDLLSSWEKPKALQNKLQRQARAGGGVCSLTAYPSLPPSPHTPEQVGPELDKLQRKRSETANKYIAAAAPHACDCVSVRVTVVHGERGGRVSCSGRVLVVGRHARCTTPRTVDHSASWSGRCSRRNPLEFRSKKNLRRCSCLCSQPERPTIHAWLRSGGV